MAWPPPGVAAPLRTAWDFMRLVHPPVPADAILTLGSFDVRAAVHAAALWKAGLAPLIIMSGGIAHRGGLLDTGWDKPEARVFADAAVAEGVPATAILLEEQAQNTADNFVLSRALAEQAGRRLRKLLAVAKPYMTRRGYATGRKAWPEVELLMQCEAIDVADYFAREAEPERTLLALVGDLHRIVVYPALGFQIAQDVPPAVIDALRRLVEAGYGARLVAGYDVAGKPTG
ncbi:MAG: YdcF family protein [Reyranella sp.]|uniref:YdcF family protein n=1 Tax=Reyranella sp. TaxID=1929291 RepID=UPI001AC6162B|nr:YdcF family protein [Reyranella sp.]MBN9090367.1 YdcF family protein [Reyranella sp.]